MLLNLRDTFPIENISYKMDQNKYFKKGTTYASTHTSPTKVDSNLKYQLIYRKEIHHKGIANMTTIKLGSSCGANIVIEQEIDSSSYFHKPVVQRWNTPFSSWWC